MEVFTPLGAAMARLAGRLGSVDPSAAGRAELERSMAAARRLRGFADEREASCTLELERLVREELAAAVAGGRAAPDDAVADDAVADDAVADDVGHGDGGAPQDDGSTHEPGAGDGFADGSGVGDGETDGSEPVESAEELRQRIRRANWLRRCPLFAAALQAGSITGAHVDLLAVTLEGVEADVVTEVLAEEDRLLDVARTVSKVGFGRFLRDLVDRVRADGGMARFERQLRKSFASFKADDATQMYRLFCEIDPVRGAAMYAAVERRVDAMYQTAGATDGLNRGQVVLQALHDLVCREPVAETDTEAAIDEGACPDIVVICDCRTLVSGEHSHTICETYEGIRLPVSFVRDMCAEAMLTVAIAGADGQVLEVGTAERLATREQRRALRAMYRTCAHPGCDVGFARCRIHHVLPWQQHGPTDLANLLPLCFAHHHLVHEGGWRLTIDADRTLHWHRPDGTRSATTPFVPLLATATQRAASPRGSPPTRAARGSPADGDPPVAAARLFDPAA